jgi:signal transduction histidine kinase
MNSLRTRFALVLVVSIICVVAVATMATFFVIHSFEEDAVGTQAAEQIMSLAPLFPGAENGSRPTLAPAPMPGNPREDLTQLIRKHLSGAVSSFDIIVTQPVNSWKPVVSVKVGAGWISIPIRNDRPRPAAWLAILGWTCLISIGTGGIALMVAHGITRHLGSLERAALAFDADGVLPPLPEGGPAEVRATTRALNTMRSRLKTAIESRMRLVAAAGHDLRTPMTRMRLRAEFLEENERAAWLVDLKELETIADSAIQLVRDEVNEQQYEPIRVDEMLANTCRQLAALHLPIKMCNSEQATVWSSPLALTRGLRNLIINAATHGKGAEVTVSVRAGMAIVAIEDEGPGIPEELMSRVFEPFFRVDAARRKSVPGAGLGLAIAKELIERHGGSLTIQNRMLGGLRQEVIFPLGRPRDSACREHCGSAPEKLASIGYGNINHSSPSPTFHKA